jgi:hypothetical protein
MRMERALVEKLTFVGPTQLRGREHETVIYALHGAGHRRAVA